MLRRLIVSDFRVVEKLTLKPGPGLSMITGETGAGKSVLVGALEAALGQEVSRDDVRAPAESATIIAEFVLDSAGTAASKIRDLLDGWKGPDLVLERRIYSGGRSSCWIEGRQVDREFLSSLGEWLVDIHGQHSHQLLLTIRSQLEILDEFAGLRSEREDIAKQYRRWQELKRIIKESKAQSEKAEREEEERTYRLAELRSAAIQAGEKAGLEKELRLLSAADEWKRVCGTVRFALVEEDGAAAEKVAKAIRELTPLGEQFPQLARSLKALESSLVELQELGDLLLEIDGTLEVNPARQQEVEERLSVLIRLEKKYGRDEGGLLELKDRLESERQANREAGERLSTLEKDLEQVREVLEDVATNVSRGRWRAAEQLAPRVEEEFADLGMEQSRFLARIEPKPVRDGFAGDAKGKERVSFLFSSSPAEEPKELSKVASGGELSRIMLALKGVLGNSDPVETMLFDEIDTGIGGGLARVIGERLRRLSHGRQVICITHLAPIASRADHHFLVEKETGDRISIKIRELQSQQRVSEIARMLGGLPVTSEAKRHAEALLADGEAEGENESNK